MACWQQRTQLVYLILQQLANVLGAIGALLMVLRRKSSFIVRQVGLLALAAVVLLMVIRFSGTLADAYNRERAHLQALVFLAITLCWILQRLAGLRKRTAASVLAVAAASLTVILVSR